MRDRDVVSILAEDQGQSPAPTWRSQLPVTGASEALMPPSGLLRPPEHTGCTYKEAHTHIHKYEENLVCAPLKSIGGVRLSMTADVSILKN